MPEAKIIWLIGLRPNPEQPQRNIFSKMQLWLLHQLCRLTLFWPRLLVQNIGSLPDGSPVRLLELPYTRPEFRALPGPQRRQQLQKALDWLARPQNQAKKIGLPLSLQTFLPKHNRPPLLADGWQLAAWEFVRQAATELKPHGGIKDKQVAVLGVDNACPAERHICDALLAHHCRPVLYGAHALGLAEYYYQKHGIAIPVFGARKAIRSSSVILVLNGQSGKTADSLNANKAVFYFREPRVRAAGQFSGRFAFGAFPAGQAAALLEQIEPPLFPQADNS